MRPWCISLLALTACDQVFGLHGRDAGVAEVDAPPAACVMPAISDAFDGADPCRPWGYAAGGSPLAPMTQTGGHLTIAPHPLQQEFNGCIAAIPMPFGPSGAFTEISRVLDYSDANTTFKIDAASPDGALGATLNVTQGTLYLLGPTGDEITHVPYDGTAMRWWGLRPDRAAGTIVAETSPDGRAWSRLGTMPAVVPDTVLVEISASVYGTGSGAPGEAVFEQLDVCPP